MSLADFRQLVGDCSDEEIDRLRSRYKLYYREHRQVFTDLLSGKYNDEASFRRAALEARKTHVGGELTRTSAAGLARTNDRKFIKLAARVLYLRMTGGAGASKEHEYPPSRPLPRDSAPPMLPSAAKKRLISIFEPWAVGYDTIRQTYAPFQDEQ